MKVINNGTCVVVSATDLKKLHACENGLKTFKQAFPKGATLSINPEANQKLAERLYSGSVAYWWFLSKACKAFRADIGAVRCVQEGPDRAIQSCTPYLIAQGLAAAADAMINKRKRKL
jgi:hypothetical protein